MTAGIEAAANAVLDALRLGNPYNRWLLIFDNADQPEGIRQYFSGRPGATSDLVTKPPMAGNGRRCPS
jgi:hypothetical protein